MLRAHQQLADEDDEEEAEEAEAAEEEPGDASTMNAVPRPKGRLASSELLRRCHRHTTM